MLISLMDGPLVWSNHNYQSGTLMPSGAVHTIIARSASDEAIQTVAAERFWIASLALAMTVP